MRRSIKATIAIDHLHFLSSSCAGDKVLNVFLRLVIGVLNWWSLHKV